MLVSGSATAEAVAQQMERSAPAGADPGLDDLKSALERLGGAAYGKAGADEGALDEALAQARRATGATARQHTWIARLVRHIRGSAAGLREKAWAR
jgi:hypothetical protein